MIQTINQYLFAYIFHRIETDCTIKFDSENRLIIFDTVQLFLPEINRSSPVKVDILGHAIAFYRHTDDQVTILSSDVTHMKLTWDILGETFDHLTLVPEQEQTFDPSNSELFFPILDMKLYYFFQLLQRVIPLRFRNYRQGKNFALCLSHDIDRTGDSWRYRVFTHIFQMVKQKRPGLLLQGVVVINNETNFKEILEKEEKVHATSTWFILSRYGLRKNADYHLSDKDFCKSIAFIQEKNHELGLHVPFMDLTVENMQTEITKISHISKVVHGARMHHLRGEYPNVLEIFDKAGLQYDSTFGFNWYMAYRFGSSIPFHPIITHNGEQIFLNIFEVPLNIMDIQVSSVDDFHRKIKELFRILAEVLGVCVINWHNNRFNQIKYRSLWKDTFDIILQEGLAFNALFTSIAEIVEYTNYLLKNY